MKLRYNGNYRRERHIWLCLYILKLKSLMCFLLPCRNAIYNINTLSTESGYTEFYSISREGLGEFAATTDVLALYVKIQYRLGSYIQGQK